MLFILLYNMLRHDVMELCYIANNYCNIPLKDAI